MGGLMGGFMNGYMKYPLIKDGFYSGHGLVEANVGG